jgi:hypothetical protein
LCPCCVELLGITVNVVLWLSDIFCRLHFVNVSPLATCTGVEVVLDEKYHLVFQSLLQPKLVKDLFASSKSGWFLCVCVLMQGYGSCIINMLNCHCLQFIVHNLGREKTKLLGIYVNK